MPRYVALLRGINVGGKNLNAMPKLKACFEAAGFDDVATYIQSGNVIFETTRGQGGLADDIESALEATFDIPLLVVVRSHQQLAKVVTAAPKGFGTEPETYRYDVMFLKEPLSAKTVVKDVPVKEGVDEVSAGSGVIYSSRLASRATQSRVSRFVSMPVYKSVTVRNWNTTTKLLSLLDARR
ncbi:MAG: DUF1697 domain-containing protein [Actinomycetota bacterium]